MKMSKNEKLRKIEECEIISMERKDHSWYSTIQSADIDHISFWAIGDTKESSIENCKKKWRKVKGLSYG